MKQPMPDVHAMFCNHGNATTMPVRQRAHAVSLIDCGRGAMHPLTPAKSPLRQLMPES